MTGGSAANSGAPQTQRRRGPRAAHGCRRGGAGWGPYRRGGQAPIIQPGV